MANRPCPTTGRRTYGPELGRSRPRPARRFDRRRTPWPMSQAQDAASGARPRATHPIDDHVVTTAERTVVPIPPPADAETFFPYEVEKYAPNGYGRWEYGPGTPHERRLELLPRGTAVDGRCRRTPPGAVLHHHRHPPHRQGVAGRRPILIGLPRRQPARHLRLLDGDALHDPRARRRRADRSTLLHQQRRRSTSGSPSATRRTTRSATSCAGSSTSSTAQLIVPADRPRRWVGAGRRAPRTSSPSRPPGSIRRSRGSRPSATTTSSGWA